MSFERRPYEEKAVRAIRAQLADRGRVVAVGPTGCGKTVVASLAIKRETRWNRVLWLAHRYELVDQAQRALERLGVRAGVMMAQEERLHGEARTDRDARVQVASVQTIDRRRGDLASLLSSVDLVVFDEAHRVMADSYQRVASACSSAAFLGLTATPIRMDGRGLGDFFDHMVTIAKPSELYESGFLARPRTFGAPIEAQVQIIERLKGVSKSGGDFAKGELERAVDTSFLVGHVVSEALKHAPKVPKVVFASGVEHSKRLVKAFRRKGIKAEHLDGNTPPDERELILDGLRSGTIEVVCNVDVLSEGWDLPNLGCVSIARPTASMARFLQMTGRVQRPHGRRVPIVLDHGYNCQRHRMLPDEDVEWTLEGSTHAGSGASHAAPKTCPDCLRIIEERADECPHCGFVQPMTERKEKEAISAKLEELKQRKRDEIRARVEEMARKKNAPKGWVEKVMQEIAA